jgi:hypothetical protein
MALRGVTSEYIPYVPEDDRSSPLNEQTIFWIKPKTGHDSNKTMQRYIGATKENTRKGIREVNVIKLDTADQEEFMSICNKVENYIFPKSSHLHNEGKIHKSLEKPEELIEVVKTLSADHLQEIFEVANNLNKLTDGAKKNSNS